MLTGKTETEKVEQKVENRIHAKSYTFNADLARLDLMYTEAAER